VVCVVRLLLLISVASGCAIPGQLYEVAPAMSGRVHGGEFSDRNVANDVAKDVANDVKKDFAKNDAQLTLKVANDASADLFAREQVLLPSDGRFAFEPLELAVAGHEYNKNYRAFLHLRLDGKERVIWRARYSRRMLTGPVVLDCDLERPAQHGQPCWVEDPLQHPWLIADGERTYRRLCVKCHGIDGSGAVGSAKTAGNVPAADLRKIAARNAGRFDRAAVTEWIEGRSSPDAHGTRSMPIWGERLSTEYERYPDSQALIAATIDPLVVYLESLQQPD
jgi:hypothetical protein